MKIIDIHAHVFPDAIAERAVKNLENHYNMKWDREGTFEDIEKSMESAGIDKTVIFSTATKPAQVQSVNNFMSGLNGGKFISFGSLHPDYDDIKGEAKRVKEMGLWGFKFHPDFQAFNIDDDKAFAMYEAIGDDYPIMVHTGDETFDFSAPGRMARALERFPTHKFIAAHMGGYSRWDESFDCLVGKNIYFDTSSSLCKLPPERMVEMIRMHGVDKILFGTDYPAVSHKSEKDMIDSLNLTEEEKEKIFCSNALKLLKINI